MVSNPLPERDKVLLHAVGCDETSVSARSEGKEQVASASCALRLDCPAVHRMGGGEWDIVMGHCSSTMMLFCALRCSYVRRFGLLNCPEL
eukprot:SAG11_NODE_10165_length_850_cov_1.531292_2_plen_90_part_00